MTTKITSNNMFNVFVKYKKYIISIICLIMAIQFWSFQIITHAINYVPPIDTNNSVDYDALRNNLPIYDYLFLTSHIIIMVTSLGSFYFLYSNNNFWKTLFFCSLAYMVFNIFGLTKYRWENTLLVPFGSYKTLASHLEFPVLSFLILFWIRKDILLKWKALLIGSLYLTYFYITTMIVYYSVTFVNEEGIIENIKMYDFLDFSYKVMIFPTDTWPLWIIVNFGLILITPIAGFVIFFVFSFIYQIKFEKFKPEREIRF